MQRIVDDVIYPHRRGQVIDHIAPFHQRTQCISFQYRANLYLESRVGLQVVDIVVVSGGKIVEYGDFVAAPQMPFRQM